MSRNHPAIVRLNADVYGQRPQTSVRSQFGPSTSLLDATRMIDYPTPSRTQSPATSISGSSGPTSPSQGLGLLDCPFQSRLVNAYSTSAPSSFHPATSIGDWSFPISMCANPYEENRRLNLLPPASHTTSSACLDAVAFYTSPAISSSSSMHTPSANIDFAFAQQHVPVMFPGGYHGEQHLRVKREDDSDSWFNDHIDLGRSHSSIDLSLYGNIKSPSLSPSQVTSADLVPSPEVGFVVLSPAPSSEQALPFESSPTARSGHADDYHTLQALGSSQIAAKGRRHSANGERRYVCSVCDRGFGKKYNLREHVKKHDPSRVSQFPCPEPGCGKRLGRRTDVNRHVQSVHEKAKRFVCTRCMKRFDRKDTLAR
jgi:Zinc finger, C2H2 type